MNVCMCVCLGVGIGGCWLNVSSQAHWEVFQSNPIQWEEMSLFRKILLAETKMSLTLIKHLPLTQTDMNESLFPGLL